MRSPLTSTSMPIGRKPSASMAVVELVGGDDPRTEGRGEVLALRRAEAHLHLAALDVAGRPVVEDRVPEDVAGGVARASRSRPSEPATPPITAPTSSSKSSRSVCGGRTVCAGRDDRVRVREVEGRELVPLVDHVAGAVDRGGDALDVLLERHEVAHARRARAGRAARRRRAARMPRRPASAASAGTSARPAASTSATVRPRGKRHDAVADDEALADDAVVVPARDPHAARSDRPCRERRQQRRRRSRDRIARSSAAASPASRTRSTGSSTPMSNG